MHIRRVGTLSKLLLAALCMLWLWILSMCAWFFGWPALLAIGAAMLLLRWLADANPERWGWLFVWPRPPPKPVDPAAMDGDPVF